MNSLRLALTFCLLGGTFAASSCATIVSGRDAEVAVNTHPQNAHVAIRNSEGQVVGSGTTPMKVSLKRGNGLFKKPPRYTAIIEKPGYKPARVAIKPKVNPWIAGNVALGGVIGLAADSASGAMWQMTPKEINHEFTPLQGPLYGQADSGEVSQATYVSDQPNR